MQNGKLPYQESRISNFSITGILKKIAHIRDVTRIVTSRASVVRVVTCQTRSTLAPERKVDLAIVAHPTEAGRNAEALQALHPSFPTEATRLDLERSARIPDVSRETRANCAACPLFRFSRCGGEDGQSASNIHLDMSRLSYTTHTAAARRAIRHPKEWSDYVMVICSGRAVSSITLPDGRRQVLSILLPGDVVCASSLFEPISGYAADAITDVTYRRFNRSEFKALLTKNYGLFERLAKMWAEESERADQLALDLGRRRADERVARFILNLAERLARRGMAYGQTMDFPLRQRHIADATGLTAVHVSKVLGEFQRLGMINIHDRSLTIVDESELRRVGAPH
jgi:CRP/FNR family transcriptional regulator, anaerobic regulatory protein